MASTLVTKIDQLTKNRSHYRQSYKWVGSVLKWNASSDYVNLVEWRVFKLQNVSEYQKCCRVDWSEYCES